MNASATTTPPRPCTFSQRRKASIVSHGDERRTTPRPRLLGRIRRDGHVEPEDEIRTVTRGRQDSLAQRFLVHWIGVDMLTVAAIQSSPLRLSVVAKLDGDQMDVRNSSPEHLREGIHDNPQV